MAFLLLTDWKPNLVLGLDLHSHYDPHYLVCPTTHSQDGQVTVDEFKQAIQKNCNGKGYSAFPTAFKVFISNMFKTIDVNGESITTNNCHQTESRSSHGCSVPFVCPH